MARFSAREWCREDQHMEQDIYDRCLGLCAYCGKPQSRFMRGPWSEPDCWQIDHFYARSRGGTNVLGIVVVACSACHRRKHSNPQHLLPIRIALRPPSRKLTIRRNESVPLAPLASDGHCLADLVCRA